MLPPLLLLPTLLLLPAAAGEGRRGGAGEMPPPAAAGDGSGGGGINAPATAGLTALNPTPDAGSVLLSREIANALMASTTASLFWLLEFSTRSSGDRPFLSLARTLGGWAFSRVVTTPRDAPFLHARWMGSIP